MEAVPTVPCHQAASCPSQLLLGAFPRELVKAISGETKTVKSVHGRPGTSVDVFFNGDRAVRKSTQASASQKKHWQPQAPRCSGRETISLISCIVML